MKVDLYTKAVLTIIALLLFVVAANGLFASKAVQADQSRDHLGRYEISAWASQVGPIGHHSGYYVLDTITGKVVETHEDVHPAGPRETVPTQPEH